MSDESEDDKPAKDGINATSIEHVCAALDGQCDSGPEASHRVVHQDGDRVTFKACNWRFATRRVGELFAREVLKRGPGSGVLRAMSGPLNTNSSSRGHFFEACQHDLMCEGGIIRKYKIVDVPTDFSLTRKRGRPSTAQGNAIHEAIAEANDAARKRGGLLPGVPLQMRSAKLDMHFFKGGTGTSIGEFAMAVNESTVPRYLRPDNFVHPVIDACIYPDTLLNFKVGSTATLDEQILENHLQCLPDREVYYFDFCLPADKMPSFRPSLLIRDETRHPRVARTMVRVIEA